MTAEFITWLAIGLGVGSILGLTGAGGAIFSVPLFIHFVHVSPREATVLSLITVASGAITNTIIQRKNVVWKYSLTIGLCSIVGSLIIFQVKQISPNWVIASLFFIVGTLGLWNIWKPKKNFAPAPKSRSHFTVWVPLQGVMLGGLSTMTGLGGGLVLVPWLKSRVGLELRQAVATSLGSIAIISTGSLSIQARHIPDYLTSEGLILLIVGVVGGSRLVRSIAKRHEGPGLDHTRRIVFSLIIFYAAFTLISRY